MQQPNIQRNAKLEQTDSHDVLAVKHSLATVLIAACAIFMGTASQKAYAQSEASAVVSMLPVASVVVTGMAASTVAGAVIAASISLSAAGAVLVVKTVESTARGTVYVLERASDGARVSVELAGKAVGGASLAAGSVVAVTVIGSGMVLSALGEAIAFIPNEIGKALLHNERITY
jgi:hypothetical protein